MFLFLVILRIGHPSVPDAPDGGLPALAQRPLLYVLIHSPPTVLKNSPQRSAAIGLRETATALRRVASATTLHRAASAIALSTAPLLHQTASPPR